MNNSYHPPEEVVVGLANRPNHEHFNDMNVLSKHQFPHKIHKIHVQYNNDHVWGVKFTYKCGPHNKDVEGESSMKFKPLTSMFTSLTKDDFVIHDDDYLMEIFGYAGVEIN